MRVTETKQLVITCISKEDGTDVIGVHNELPYYKIKKILRETLRVLVKEQYPDADEETINQLVKV